MDKVIETIGLTKKYGKTNVVDNVSLTVNKGDIYGLIGKNGAGKTTIIRIISGMTTPTSGEVKLFESNELENQRKNTGTIIENPAIYTHLTAKQNIQVMMKLLNIKDNNEADRLLNIVGLGDTKRKKAGNFSLGMKQRLAIAISLVGNPKFLLLDEPTNGLDPEGIKQIRDLIENLNQKEGITILISSHILSELSKFATRYGIINNGKLIEEFNAKELETKSNKSIVLKVDDNEKAIKIIKEKFQIEKIKEISGNIVIMEKTDMSSEINKELTINDIKINSINEQTEDLEEYFINIIGGKE